jgi:uncharacterized LabA/DUF88 family protein
MNRVGVFVDAGYLLASGGALLVGSPVKRVGLDLDIPAVAARLRHFAEAQSGLPLLRTYWYDGTNSGPSPEHVALACQDQVKVRLGRVNELGQQKGVDSLIITDMITLARNGGMATAVLVTGDEDIRVGVQHVQEHGVVVHLVGIAPSQENQSNLLSQEADITHEWEAADLAPFLTVSPVVALPPSPSADTPPEQVTRGIAASVIATLDPAERSRLRLLFEGGEWRVPPEYDRVLVKALAQQLPTLSDEAAEAEKLRVRQAFKTEI